MTAAPDARSVEGRVVQPGEANKRIVRRGTDKAHGVVEPRAIEADLTPSMCRAEGEACYDCLSLGFEQMTAHPFDDDHRCPCARALRVDVPGVRA